MRPDHHDHPADRPWLEEFREEPDPDAERGFRELREGLIRGRAPGGPRWSVPVRAALAMALASLLIGAAATILLVRSGAPDGAVLIGGTEASAGDPVLTVEPTDAEPDPSLAVAESLPSAEPVAGPGSSLKVYVIGQVRRPGVVPVTMGARVLDAIEAAGGATRRADLTRLNLARKLADGEQILVPRPGQRIPGGTESEASAQGAAGGADGAPINLNTASAQQLEELPGVGPVLAGRIVEWRTSNGLFTSVDDLNEVSGIGDTTMAELRPLVQV